jgi:hypothetical protein
MDASAIALTGKAIGSLLRSLFLFTLSNSDRAVFGLTLPRKRTAAQ